MRKNVLVFALFLFSTLTLSAQIDFGIKAGVNFNSDTFQFKEDVPKLLRFDTNSKMGYHAGIWSRFKLPLVGLYVRPELVYTALNSEVKLSGGNSDYSFKKIDIPVLLGYKFLKFGHAFIGPSFQYVIDNDVLSIENIKKIDGKGFTVGLQLGLGVEISKFGLDVRWERAFSDIETKFLGADGKVVSTGIDTRINQIIIGLSYNF